MEERYDAVVIGGGPAGYTCAIRLAQLGRKTLCVEKAEVGGVCLNWGCIPSKALIDTAHLHKKIREAEAVGIVGLGEPRIDAVRMQAWKAKIVARLVGGISSLLKANGATVALGTARITGPNRVEINAEDGATRSIEADAIVLATGSSTASLPSLPFDGERILGAREALSLSTIPGRMLVVGGGVIGVELGSMYHRLGASVTVVEALPVILNGIDRDCVGVVERTMKRDGMQVRVATRVSSAERVDDGVRVTFEADNAAPAPATFDIVLVAVGMRPNSNGLGLESVGLQPDARGFLPTDAEGRTSVPSIFAIGDLTGPPMLAHKAFKEGVIAAEVIAGNKASKDWRGIPAAVFSDPEIAYVGLTEAEAQKQGHTTRVGRMPFNASGRAMAMRETEGFVKTVTDSETHRILGVHIVGPRASDMISEAALALEMGAFADDVALTIHPHPTLGEAMMISSEHALGQATDILNR